MKVRRLHVPPVARTKEYYEVKRIIEQGSSCLVVGFPYGGQINLLNGIQMQFDNDSYIPILVDAVAVKGSNRFWQSVYQRLLEGSGLGAEKLEMEDVLREITNEVESLSRNRRTCILLVDEIDRLLSTSPEEVRRLLAGLKSLLNSGALLVATSYQTRRMWRDSWCQEGNEVIAILLEEIFGREVVLAPWTVEEVREFLRVSQVPDFVQSVRSRDDLPQLVMDQTGGIPYLADVLITRFQQEDESDVTQTWESILNEVQDSEFLFSGFWLSLPKVCQQELFVAFVRAKLKQAGSWFGLSRTEFDRIINKYFSTLPTSVTSWLIKQDMGISSNILNEWIEHFVVHGSQQSSYAEVAKFMIQDIVARDFSDADMIASYFEWVGVSSGLTLARERKQRKDQMRDEIAQRVMGFFLIGLVILAVLRLSGLL